jgi:hypothetical protein
MGKVDGEHGGGAARDNSAAQKVPPSRRGDGFITFDSFIRYGNQAFASCQECS